MANITQRPPTLSAVGGYKKNEILYKIQETVLGFLAVTLRDASDNTSVVTKRQRAIQNLIELDFSSNLEKLVKNEVPVGVSSSYADDNAIMSFFISSDDFPDESGNLRVAIAARLDAKNGDMAAYISGSSASLFLQVSRESIVYEDTSVFVSFVGNLDPSQDWYLALDHKDKNGFSRAMEFVSFDSIVKDPVEYSVYRVLIPHQKSYYKSDFWIQKNIPVEQTLGDAPFIPTDSDESQSEVEGQQWIPNQTQKQAVFSVINAQDRRQYLGITVASFSPGQTYRIELDYDASGMTPESVALQVLESTGPNTFSIISQKTFLKNSVSDYIEFSPASGGAVVYLGLTKFDPFGGDSISLQTDDLIIFNRIAYFETTNVEQFSEKRTAIYDNSMCENCFILTWANPIGGFESWKFLGNYDRDFSINESEQYLEYNERYSKTIFRGGRERLTLRTGNLLADELTTLKSLLKARSVKLTDCSSGEEKLVEIESRTIGQPSNRENRFDASVTVLLNQENS